MDIRNPEIAAGEAKARFSELLARAELGETITIKRHGRAVAKIVAVAPTNAQERAARVTEFLAWRDAHVKVAEGMIDYKALIYEGRR